MINRFSPGDLPSLLFKYRDWKNFIHRRLITHQELYLSSPSAFNDPFDGNAPVRYDLMTYEECFARNLEIAKCRYIDIAEQQKYAKELTDSKEFFHPETLKSESPEQLKKWAEIIGLVSLSEVRDNILMWSHYAGSHSGFVVGLDTESLIRDHDFDYIDRMQYLDEYPMIGGMDAVTEKFRKKFFSKSKEWSYEREWRISKNHIKNRTYKLRKENFREIIIGCNASGGTKHQIISAVKEAFDESVKIYSAQRNPEKYSLDLIEVSLKSYLL